MKNQDDNFKSNSLESLLEEYYAKNKNLNIQKIKKVSGKFEENRKRELFKLVRKNDFDLEKTKKVLFFIEELTGLSLHQEQLCDFVSDVVMQHDVMVGHEKKEWFSNKEVSKIEFNKLFGKIEGSNKSLSSMPKSKLSKLETDIKKARLNALNISLLCKYRKKILTFKEFLGQLQQNTYIAHITIRESKTALELSKAQFEKIEAKKIISNTTIDLKKLKDDLNAIKDIQINNNNIDKNNLKTKKEIKKIIETETINKIKAEEALEIAIKKIKVIEGGSKNNIIFNQTLEEKILPFILTSKQDDINNISNLMKFYYEQNQENQKHLSTQYQINLKLESAIKSLNEKIIDQQASEKQHKVELNNHINYISELKQNLASIEQSKIETKISTKDKENTMKGDLNNWLSKEIPKIETALTAIEMGKTPFVEQYLKRLLEQFGSKLNESLKDK